MVCQDMVINLRKKYILNANDNDYIVGVSGHRLPQSEQNSRLVDTITMRTPKGFEAFLQALKETGHEEAYNKLKKTLDGLSDGAEPVHTRRKNSSVSEVTIADEKELVFPHPSTSRSLSSESGYQGDVTHRLLERVQEAGQRGQQITDRQSFGSDYDNSSREGSEQDFQDKLGSLSGRVDHIEHRLDGLEGQAGQKKITDEQQSEVARLKEELESARAEIQTLTKALQSQDSEIKEEKEVNRLRSEQLHEAKKKVEELLDQIKRLEEVNVGLKKGLQALERQGEKDRLEIANMKTELKSQKKNIEQTNLAQKEGDTKMTLLCQQMEKLQSEMKRGQSTQQNTPAAKGSKPQPQDKKKENRPQYSPANTLQFPGRRLGRDYSTQKK